MTVFGFNPRRKLAARRAQVYQHAISGPAVPPRTAYQTTQTRTDGNWKT